MHAPWRGAYRRGESLARHCSWRCGGPADHYFEPADREELKAYLASNGIDPLFWLGLGSNLLIRDGGLRGTVISTANLVGCEWRDDTHLYAEAGVPCARIARAAAAQDRAGLEFLAGIPGTLGGALRMNAGALGGETWQFVAWAELIDRRGAVTRIDREQFQASYRRVRQPQPGWFIAALLHVPLSAQGEGNERIRQVLAQRGASQPTGKASCGSVFKNPPGDYAGRLIESCGLKGFRIGGCEVSPVHANFIVNDAGARAADVEHMIRHVQATVRAHTGVALETEVQIVGDAGEASA
ncbi:MAG: UDP-N-acetylmuramate dehydrogenase [Gammaproteobacteria bacterium]|nr:UDP-N-acetylmuramate dehydrogenase [Gammaproteobacteria bacterium]